MSRNISNRMTSVQFLSHGVQDGQQQYQANQAPQYSKGFERPPQEQTPMFEQTTEEAEGETSNHLSNLSKPLWKRQAKKISNKERRRRQNQCLRRLVTPKSALMVLNEMICNAPLLFRVTENLPQSGYYAANQAIFTAELTIDGRTYRGCGDTKTAARTAAAEPAVRDLIIKKMAKYNNQAHNENKDGDGDEKMETEDKDMPMIQLASFALHKLFSEWEGEGHQVPQIKPNSSVTDTDTDSQTGRTAPKPKKVKTLPENAGAMHPCMLLTYMRPLQEYREISVQGDRPQNLVYTIGVEVDCSTFIGQGPNKREARKAAATAACKALFGVEFQ